MESLYAETDVVDDNQDVLPYYDSIDYLIEDESDLDLLDF